MNVTEHDIFQRTELLLGSNGLDRLAALRVIVVGVGGVGSWCAESLVRSGVRRLTIADPDLVCASNINRQLMATTGTIGQPKVEVMRRRLLSINPQADITARREAFTAETADRFDLGSYDFVVDAIDSLRDKALLILTVCQLPSTRLLSSMGAALKLDPSRIRVAEFWRVEGDPLARALRKRFKREGRYPARKFQCVYSDERLQNQNLSQTDEADGAPAPRANGTVAHITAIFGLTLASLVVRSAG
jgi:tRNA A37 threonylcarbamoyladenosine dehydratase